jgi:hypothetical protein
MAGKGFSKGHKKVGGRVKGTPNTIDKDVRILARQYTTKALDRLVAILDDKEASDSAAVAAANAILDRAYGRPQAAVAVTGANGEPLIPVDTPRQVDDHEEWCRRRDREMDLGASTNAA